MRSNIKTVDNEAIVESVNAALQQHKKQVAILNAQLTGIPTDPYQQEIQRQIIFHVSVIRALEWAIWPIKEVVIHVNEQGVVTEVEGLPHHTEYRVVYE